jgi:hypothetical protein
VLSDPVQHFPSLWVEETMEIMLFGRHELKDYSLLASSLGPEAEHPAVPLPVAGNRCGNHMI